MCITYQTDIQKWNKYIDFSLFILFIYFLIVGLRILLMASSACMASSDECLNMNRVASGGWIVREGRQITEWHELWLKTNNRWKKIPKWKKNKFWNFSETDNLFLTCAFNDFKMTWEGHKWCCFYNMTSRRKRTKSEQFSWSLINVRVFCNTKRYEILV